MSAAQEYYIDYWALDRYLVSLELDNNAACLMPQSWESTVRPLPAACCLLESARPESLRPHACLHAGDAARLRPHD